MSPEELLKEGLRQSGLSHTTKQISLFMTYLAELKRWNRVHNLTSLSTDCDIVRKHFLDSVAFLKAFPGEAHGKCRYAFVVADVGSGAGFPGIPLRIIRPETALTLIEPSRKKSAFLRHIRRKLNLEDVTIIGKRIESLSAEFDTAFDVIVTRATMKTGDFVVKALPRLKVHGRILLSKGPRVHEELRSVTKAGSIVVQPVNVPYLDAWRNLVIVRKVP